MHRSHFLAALDRLGVVRGFETQITGRDGRTLKLRTMARVHRDASGQVAYAEGAVEDVTEALPTVGFYLDAARFHRMFRVGLAGLIMVGIDGVIQDANPAFLSVSGYEVGELIQTLFADLWAEEDQTMIRQDLAALGVGSEECSEGTQRFRSHQGNLISAHVTMALVRDGTTTRTIFWWWSRIWPRRNPRSARTLPASPALGSLPQLPRPRAHDKHT